MFLKRKNILKAILKFINVDDLLEFNFKASNKKKKIKSRIIRDLLYNESMFKKAFQTIIPSNELRVKFKEIIDYLNSNNYSDHESKYEIDVIVEEDLYENPKANSVMYEFKTYQEAFNYLDENKDSILQNFLKLHDLFVVEDIE